MRFDNVCGIEIESGRNVVFFLGVSAIAGRPGNVAGHRLFSRGGTMALILVPQTPSELGPSWFF